MGLREKDENGLLYLTVPSFEKAMGVSHCFTTRVGGVSENEFSSLNLGLTRGDKRENVLENFTRLARLLKQDITQFVLTKQTHHDRIEIVTQKDCGKGLFLEGFDDADGLITNEKGVILCVFVADCVPVLLYDPVKKVIGAVHSGWRGTASLIAPKAIHIMKNQFGCEPMDILVGIGPSIERCHFEIGKEVADILGSIKGCEKAVFQNECGSNFASLREMIKITLLDEGVPDENITVSDECTMCKSEKYFSHRKMGDKRGNMAAAIVMDE